MAKQIIWTLKAKNEWIEILEYWNNRNKSNTFSLKLNDLIVEQLKLIAKYPAIGRKTDIANVSVKIVHKYLLFYEHVNDTIFVLTIRHGSRNPDTLKLR